MILQEIETTTGYEAFDANILQKVASSQRVCGVPVTSSWYIPSTQYLRTLAPITMKGTGLWDQ